MIKFTNISISSWHNLHLSICILFHRFCLKPGRGSIDPPPPSSRDPATFISNATLCQCRPFVSSNIWPWYYLFDPPPLYFLTKPLCLMKKSLNTGLLASTCDGSDKLVDCNQFVICLKSNWVRILWFQLRAQMLSNSFYLIQQSVYQKHNLVEKVPIKFLNCVFFKWIKLNVLWLSC